MNAELSPRPHFEDLFQRAEAARQRDEGIGERGHHGLALMHRLHDVHLGGAAMPHFAIPQRTRDHSHHPPSLGQRGVRKHAHQPDVPAAVDQRDALAGEQRTEAARGGGEGGIAAGRGAAEDAETRDHRFGGPTTTVSGSERGRPAVVLTRKR